MASALLMPAFVGSASAASVDLKKYVGADYKIWIPARPYVSAAELFIIVNYADSDILIKVTGVMDGETTNKTYFIATIGSRDCEILEIPFPDVETTYFFSLLENNVAVFSVVFYHPGSYLPPVNENQWRFSPPAQFEETKKYSQSWVDTLFASVTLNTILISSAIISLGALIGIAVKLTTRFLVPVDILSYGFYATLFIDAYIFRLAPLDFSRLWFIPLLIGYWLGFMLWHIPYVMPVRINSQDKQLQIRPYVLYWPEDKNKPCIQIQTNKALISRFLGHHHELITNGGLNPDWEIFVKKPYWPKIIAPALWLQKTKTDILIKKWWIFKFKDITTTWGLANASAMPRHKWLVSTKAFYDATDYLDWSETERTRYALTHEYEAIKSAAAMITHSIKVSPIEAVKAHLEPKEQPIVEDLGEHILNEVEESELEVKEDDIETSESDEDDSGEDRREEIEEREKTDKARKTRKQKGGRKNG